MRVYGLTGGIGSGKSTVAGLLRSRGHPVVDADALAREVVAPGSEGLAEIVARFGGGLVDREGQLDRPAMAALVFGDPQARAALEAITHPRIAALAQARLREAAAQGAPMAFYEAALLVERGLQGQLDGLIVVALSPEEQLRRVMARDGATHAEAQARVDAQLPLTKKVAVADYLIDNSGALEATAAQVDELLRRLEEGPDVHSEDQEEREEPGQREPGT